MQAQIILTAAIEALTVAAIVLFAFQFVAGFDAWKAGKVTAPIVADVNFDLRANIETVLSGLIAIAPIAPAATVPLIAVSSEYPDLAIPPTAQVRVGDLNIDMPSELPIDSLSRDELRQLAKTAKVPQWWNLTKAQLIEALKNLN